MLRTGLGGIAVLALIASGCAWARGTAGTGATIEGAKQFAPQLWNAGEEVFGGSFTADQKVYYYFRKTGPGEDYRIFESRRVGSRWSPPQRVAFPDTTSDLYPSISRDGRRMVFSSYRRIPGDTSRVPNAHLWMVERFRAGWGTPRPLSRLNVLGEYHPGTSMLSDGSLYFRVITRSGRSMFLSRWSGGEYQTPQRVSPFDALQSDTMRTWGGVPTPDGRTMFLTIGKRAAGATEWGQTDVYVVIVQPDGSWSAPLKLDGAVNTDEGEGASHVTADGRYLFFSRGGRAMLRIPIASLVTVPS